MSWEVVSALVPPEYIVLVDGVKMIFKICIHIR